MALFLLEGIARLFDVEDLDCKPLGVALPGCFSPTAVQSILTSIIHITHGDRLLYGRILAASRS